MCCKPQQAGFHYPDKWTENNNVNVITVYGNYIPYKLLCSISIASDQP